MWKTNQSQFGVWYSRIDKYNYSNKCCKITPSNYNEIKTSLEYSLILSFDTINMSEELCDDVPDYMSDDFLAKCVPEDVRPGLKRVIIATSLLHSL